MIYRTETYTNSQLVKAVVVDTTAQTVATTVNSQTTVRAMTPNESAHYAAVDAATTSATNTAQMVTESNDSVDKLVAVVEALNVMTALSNAAINANPAAVIKDLARECKTIARQANREARLTSGRTESTNTGPIVP